ncbi:MAG: hypothetical protein AABW72_02185 [archaeon]
MFKKLKLENKAQVGIELLLLVAAIVFFAVIAALVVKKQVGSTQKAATDVGTDINYAAGSK